MKLFTSFTPVIVFLISILTAGDQLGISFVPGYFIMHSENGKAIMRGETFQSSVGIKLNYERHLAGYSFLQLEVGYHKSRVKIPDTVTNEYGDVIGDRDHYELIERYLPFDLRYYSQRSDFSGYGLGLTFVITKHTIITDIYYSQNQYEHEDYFSSIGLGPSIHIRFGRQLLNSHYYVVLGSTIRYTKAIKFFGQNRNFSNYSHEYFLIELNLGLGRILPMTL